MASFGDPLLLPSPPLAAGVPITKALEYSDSKQFIILGGLMVVAIIMSFIMLLGSLRKLTSNFFIQACLWGSVAFSPMLISFCIGKMTNETEDSILPSDLFTIWGAILLTWLASQGTISALNLEDNETALVVYVQGFWKYALVLGFLWGSITRTPAYLKWLLFVLMCFMMVRVSDRAFSLAFASKSILSEGVSSKAKIITEFMAWDVQNSLRGAEEVADPKTMEGYRYLVGMKHLLNNGYIRKPPCYRCDFEKERENIVTLQQIWQCEGELLSSKGGDPQGRLKDTCLAFSLFWMLLRKYTGYPLAEVVSLEEKTWNFVLYGLMPDMLPATCERAFGVIEQELSFLYDYFYTKNLVTYMQGTRTMFWRFLLMVGFVAVAQLILKNHQETLDLIISDQLPPIKLGILITKAVICAMIVFEFVLMANFLLITQWSRVDWICIYVQKQLWRSQTWKGICQRWAIEHICRFSLRIKFKHWKREIGQYSLLRSHDYKSHMRYFRHFFPLALLNKQTMGRQASESVPFSISLKTAILSSLHTNGRQLSKGKSTLRKYGLEPEFSWACSLETHTQTILVWHIATCFCELSHRNWHPKTSKSEYPLIAISLSQYCAYLVAFAPDLIPDEGITTIVIVNNVILEEANAMFHGCPDMDAKYEKMMAMTDECNDSEDPILKKGIWLGKSLMNRMGTDESLWEMLAEFWAELLLYLAPSDDATAHIKHLADGGELITHLWALLTHAGILSRD